MKINIDKTLDKLSVKEEDIIILRGEWELEELQQFGKLCQDRKMKNILIVVPEEKSIETMPEEEFYFLLKGIEKSRLKNKKK